MSSETTTATKTEEAAAAADSTSVKGGLKCPLSDRHIHREDVRKVWKECQEESFWYRDCIPLHVIYQKIIPTELATVCEECKKKAQEAPAEKA